MAPPVEEMKTRGVSLVVSDLIRHGRYKPIITGPWTKTRVPADFIEYGARLARTSYSNGRAWAGKGHPVLGTRGESRGEARSNKKTLGAVCRAL